MNIHRRSNAHPEGIDVRESLPNIKKLDKPIIFLHIEKTAGTAFTKFLRAQMPDPEVIAPPYWGGDVSSYFGDLSKCLYFGHLSYDRAYKSGVKGYYITFLRHPIQRAFSQYSSWHNPNNLTGNWKKHMQPSEIDAVLAVQNMSYQEYVMSDNPLILGHIRNLMARRLALDPWGDSTNLERAFEVLEKEFWFFGIIEEFEKSIALFKTSFSGVGEFNVPAHQSNISMKYDDSLDDIGIQRLRDLNQYDYLLYEKAVELFHKRCHQVDGL